MSLVRGPQALREKKSSGAKSRTQTRITPKPIPKPKTMRTKQTQNHYPLGAWKRTWSGSLNDLGMVGGERLQFSEGGKLRLNQTRTIAPPLGSAQPQLRCHAHIRMDSSPGPFSCYSTSSLHPASGRSSGYALPGGKKASLQARLPSTHVSGALEPVTTSPTIEAEFSDLTIH